VRETRSNVSDFYFKSVTENKKISGFRDIIEVNIKKGGIMLNIKVKTKDILRAIRIVENAIEDDKTDSRNAAIIFRRGKHEKDKP